jgi:7-carboxy-7-deazaguanine synthase
MPELLVNEIFYSIQGEGSRAGLPCVFVRLHGCGLRCAWCDTPYALDHAQGGSVWTMNALVERVAEFHCDFVMLTGGEPLEQGASIPFITELCNVGHSVAVETGGHVDVGQVDSRATLIMDVKCPGSGMVKKNRLGNLEYLKPSDEIKFVLQDREDYEWAREFLRVHKLRSMCKEILFSPVVDSLEPKLLAEWMLEDRVSARLQLQLHAIIWGRGVRGV